LRVECVCPWVVNLHYKGSSGFYEVPLGSTGFF
jgi:hypothetical protein